MTDSIPLSNLRAVSGNSPYYKMSNTSPQRLGRFGIQRDRSWTISLVGSYVFDWFVLLVVAAAGGGIALIEPNKRPFSLLDPSISSVPSWIPWR